MSAAIIDKAPSPMDQVGCLNIGSFQELAPTLMTVILMNKQIVSDTDGIFKDMWLKSLANKMA